MRNPQKNLIHLKDILPLAFNLNTGAISDPLQKVQNLWPRWLEAPLSEKTRPIKIKKDTLWISVSAPTWSHHLTLIKPELLQKIKDHCPEISIRWLKFQIES